MAKCPNCGKEVKKDLKQCPHCQSEIKPKEVAAKKTAKKGKNKKKAQTKADIKVEDKKGTSSSQDHDEKEAKSKANAKTEGDTNKKENDNKDSQAKDLPQANEAKEAEVKVSDSKKADQTKKAATEENDSSTKKDSAKNEEAQSNKEAKTEDKKEVKSVVRGFEGTPTDKPHPLSKVITPYHPDYKPYIIGILISLCLLGVFLFTLTRFNNPIPPQMTSLGQQTKQQEQHVWFVTKPTKGENAPITKIIVLKHGKGIAYQVFDENLTLKKVAKMNEDQVINLAKQQDRIYFEKAAERFEALRDGKNTEDFGHPTWMNDLNSGNRLFFSFENKNDNSWRNANLIDENQYNQLNENKKFTRVTKTEQEFVDQLGPSDKADMKMQDELKKELAKRRYNGLINNLNAMKYIEPKWQEVKIDNFNQGDEVTRQVVRIKEVNKLNYPQSTAQDILSKLSDDQKQKVQAAASSYQNTSNFGSRYNAVNEAFSQEYFNQIMRDFFKPAQVEIKYAINEPTSLDFKDARFIGYQAKDGGYLVMKAQNGSQKVILSQ